jgi:poly(3-hydroxybutyrate) depolymerase
MRNGMTAPDTRHRTPIPAIVFHGDRDTTVHPRNSDQALAQCMAHAAPKASRGEEHGKRKVSVDKGQVPDGRAYTRVKRYGEDGQVIAEQWTIHGAGHAWSGGSRKGSYTDPKGPNASREMLRFFLEHRNAGSVSERA